MGQLYPACQRLAGGAPGQLDYRSDAWDLLQRPRPIGFIRGCPVQKIPQGVLLTPKSVNLNYLLQPYDCTHFIDKKKETEKC